MIYQGAGVPEHWTPTRLRFGFADVRIGTWGSEPGTDETDVICVRVADFDWERLRIRLDQPTIRSISKQDFQRLRLAPGDILMEKSGGGEKTPVGRVVMFDGGVEAVTSNFVARLRPARHVFPRFMLYLLAALYYTGYSHQFIKQNIGIQNFDDAAFLDTRIYLPDRAAQQRIADFLDRETAAIDRVIEKKRRLIDLLTEKRCALIARWIPPPDLARKGLRLKHKLVLNDGGVWGGEPDGEHDRIVLRSTDQTLEGGWRISNPAIRSIPPLEASRRRLAVGDILITKSSGSALHIGKASLVDADVAALDAVFSNFNQRIRFKRSEEPRFYWYYLNGPIARWHYRRHANATSGLGNLNAEIIGELPIPDLDMHRQKEIADKLDEEAARIDAAREKIRQTVNKLRELRSALIVAAVTGQIAAGTWERRCGFERRMDETEALRLEG